MQNYTELKDLDDWNDDTVLIEIRGDGAAIVREHLASTIPDLYTPFDEAVRNANTLLARNPWLRHLAIRLQDGASWDEKNGQLV